MTLTDRPRASTPTAETLEGSTILPTPKRRFVGRRINLAVWQLVVAGIASLTVGAVAGASGGVSQDKYDEAQKGLAAATARINEVESQARSDVAEASQRASAAESEARAKVEAENAAKVAELDGRAAALAAKESGLADREKAVSGAEAAAKANQFNDGVWEIGTDIQPGKYKAASAGGDCYWAKLKSDDDIIDNDIPGGPTTVTIESSVAKFKSSRCGTWQRVG